MADAETIIILRCHEEQPCDVYSQFPIDGASCGVQMREIMEGTSKIDTYCGLVVAIRADSSQLLGSDLTAT